MGAGRRSSEPARSRRWRPRARWIVDGALLAAAAALLVQQGGSLRDAYDGWHRERSLRERAASRWSELTGSPSGEHVEDARTNGPVLVEFTDYRCPFCQRAQQALDSLSLVPVGPGRAAGGRAGSRPDPGLRRVVRHLPIASLHPDAPLLARVSLCAEADPAFPAVHRALYDAPSPASDAALTRLLASAGVVRPDAVLRCAASPTAAERLRDDLRLAAELRLRATPTLLARDAVHEGTLSVARLREMLRLP